LERIDMSAVVSMWNRLFGIERLPARPARRSPEEPTRDYLLRCTERTLDLALRAGEERRAAERSESRHRPAI